MRIDVVCSSSLILMCTLPQRVTLLAKALIPSNFYLRGIVTISNFYYWNLVTISNTYCNCWNYDQRALCILPMPSHGPSSMYYGTQHGKLYNITHNIPYRWLISKHKENQGRSTSFLNSTCASPLVHPAVKRLTSYVYAKEDKLSLL